MDLTKYSKGKRMVREDKIKQIDELKAAQDQAAADIEELKEDVEKVQDDVAAIPVVAANPTLEGTEPELDGLEIGGTKYAMPSGGGDLYLHLIEIKSVSTGGFPYAGIGFTIGIVSKNNLSFTTTEILSILGQNTFITNLKNKLIGANSASNTISYIEVDSTAIHTDSRLYSNVSIKNWNGTTSSTQCFYSVTDTVTLI